MSELPWFKFFASDYLSSLFVQSLDPEQELWYLRLIIASAINEPRGCLPLANSKLWRVAKAPSLEHFEKHGVHILSKFEKDDAAQLYRVPKVYEQLVSATDVSEKRSKAGKKGAAKRWQTDGKLPSVPMANEQQKIADLDSEAEVDSTIPLPPSLQEGGDVFRFFLGKLKEDLASAYVSSPNFHEEAFDKYFRDSRLIKITENGVAILDSPQPALLREGLGKFDKRLRSTFFDVSGAQVSFQVASRGNGAAA